jgi:hypothetical protein
MLVCTLLVPLNKQILHSVGDRCQKQSLRGGSDRDWLT